METLDNKVEELKKIIESSNPHKKEIVLQELNSLDTVNRLFIIDKLDAEKKRFCLNLLNNSIVKQDITKIKSTIKQDITEIKEILFPILEVKDNIKNIKFWIVFWSILSLVSLGIFLIILFINIFN